MFPVVVTSEFFLFWVRLLALLVYVASSKNRAGE